MKVAIYKPYRSFDPPVKVAQCRASVHGHRGLRQCSLGGNYAFQHPEAGEVGLCKRHHPGMLTKDQAEAGQRREARRQKVAARKAFEDAREKLMAVLEASPPGSLPEPLAEALAAFQKAKKEAARLD